MRRAELEKFLDAVPEQTLVVLDEAYREFVTDPDVPDGLELMRGRPNVAVLRTFSKAWGLAGHPGRLPDRRGPGRRRGGRARPTCPSASPCSPRRPRSRRWPARTRCAARCAAVVAERDRLTAALRERGLDVADSQANFVWLPLGEQTAAAGRRPRGARGHHPAVRRRGHPGHRRHPRGGRRLPRRARRRAAATTGLTCAVSPGPRTERGRPERGAPLGWFDGRRASSPCALRHPADGGFLPPRQLPGCAAPVGGLQDVRRGVLLRRRPARDHAAAGPGGAAPQHPRLRRAAARPRRRPRRAARCSCRATCRSTCSCPGSWSASTGFGEASRMTQFKDKSQREGTGRRLGRAVHLPGAAGRRHPRLPGRPGAGR